MRTDEDEQEKGSIDMKLSMNEATALKCKGTTLEQDLALCEKDG